MHPKQFHKGNQNESGFKPSDVITRDDADSDEEILWRFRKNKKKQPI